MNTEDINKQRIELLNSLIDSKEQAIKNSSERINELNEGISMNLEAIQGYRAEIIEITRPS